MNPSTIPRVFNVQYLRLLGEIDAAFDRARESVDEHPCKAGCDACCHGPFDVGHGDLWLLVEALEALPLERRRAVFRRIAVDARRQRERLGLGVEADPTISSVGEDDFDAMCEAFADHPCPFLSEGECSVYPYRPEPCRLQGLAIRFGDEELELECPIDLTGDIAAVRYDLPDLHDRVARLEARVRTPGVAGDRTTIALGIDAIIRNATKPQPT